MAYKDILITFMKNDYVLRTPLAKFDPMYKSQIKNQYEIKYILE